MLSHLFWVPWAAAFLASPVKETFSSWSVPQTYINTAAKTEWAKANVAGQRDALRQVAADILFPPSLTVFASSCISVGR